MKGLVEADHELAESERRSRAKRQGTTNSAPTAATVVPVSLYANTRITSLSRDSSAHNSRSNSAARGSRVTSGQPLDDSRQHSPAPPTTVHQRDEQQQDDDPQRTFGQRGSSHGQRGSSHEQQLTREFLTKATATQRDPPVYSLPTVGSSGGSGTLRVINSSTPVAAARQSAGSSAKAHRSGAVPSK